MIVTQKILEPGEVSPRVKSMCEVLTLRCQSDEGARVAVYNVAAALIAAGIAARGDLDPDQAGAEFGALVRANLDRMRPEAEGRA